jgi:hypothetical protein
VFDTSQWVEGVCTDYVRTLAAPSTYGVAENSIVAMCWHGGAGTGVQSWMMRASSDPTPGHRLTRTDMIMPSLWIGRTPTVGTTNKGLQLLELLVWTSALTAMQLGVLQQYASGRWGITFPVTDGTPSTLPADVSPSQSLFWDAGVNGTLVTNTGANPTTHNEIVKTWWAGNGTQSLTSITRPGHSRIPGCPVNAATTASCPMGAGGCDSPAARTSRGIRPRWCPSGRCLYAGSSTRWQLWWATTAFSTRGSNLRVTRTSASGGTWMDICICCSGVAAPPRGPITSNREG